jgi:hypothetical protein
MDRVKLCIFFTKQKVRIFSMGMSIDHGVDNFMCYWNLEKKHGPLFFIVLLIVWCIRNEFVFHNKKESLHTSVAKIYSLLKTFVITTHANLGFVTWSWPEEGTVCLNVDGSMQGPCFGFLRGSLKYSIR